MSFKFKFNNLQMSSLGKSIKTKDEFTHDLSILKDNTRDRKETSFVSCSKKVSQSLGNISDKKYQKTHEDSTYIQIDYDCKTSLHGQTNDAKNKQLIQSRLSHYSKCKSEAQLQNTQAKLSKGLFSQKKINLERLLQKKQCLKHKPWFDSHLTNYKNVYTDFGSLSEIYEQKSLQNKLLSISKEQKFQRLIQDLRKKHLARFEQKICKQKSQLMDRSTFVPNHIMKDQIQVNPEIHQKLYKEAEQKQNKIRLHEESKAIEQSNLLEKLRLASQDRFKQSRNKWQKLLNSEKHKSTFQQPIYQRLSIIQDQKHKMHEQLKIKYECSKSQQTVHKLSQEKQKSLVKRLIDDYRVERQQKLLNMQERQKQKFQENFPFKPRVNQNQLYQSQSIFVYEKNPSKDQKISQILTFQPKIDQTSRIIVQKNRQYFQYTDAKIHNDVAQRLYQGSNEQRKQKLCNIQAQLYDECTFSPQINEISKQLIYLSGQSDLNNVHKCPLAQSLILREKQLTFKPQINFQSKCMSLYQRQDVIVKNRQKSKSNIQKLQNQRQYKEIEQCTFQPKTLSTGTQWKKWRQNHLKKARMTNILEQKQNSQQKQNCRTSPMIKGLGNYLKNRSRVKLKKQANEKRMQQIFNFQRKYDERINRQKSNKIHKIIATL